MGELFCVAPKYRSRSTQPSNDNDEQFSLPYTIFRAWERNYHGTGNNLLARSQSRNLRYLPQILIRKKTLCCEFGLGPIVLGVRPCGLCGLPYLRRSCFWSNLVNTDPGFLHLYTNPESAYKHPPRPTSLQAHARANQPSDLTTEVRLRLQRSSRNSSRSHE